ncbi:MAG: hypothetical protein K6C97_12255 [Treponema sp.]|nr:hypothetical protein [Treponema sp.]
MDSSSLSKIQKEILKAFQDFSEKAKFTDTLLAKKVRENAKLQGNKKSILALADIEAVLECLAQDGLFYSITVNQANDLIIEKVDEAKETNPEARKRRQRSEKSMSLFTNNDLKESHSKGKGSVKGKPKPRHERKSMNIYDTYD